MSENILEYLNKRRWSYSDKSRANMKIGCSMKPRLKARSGSGMVLLRPQSSIEAFVSLYCYLTSYNSYKANTRQIWGNVYVIRIMDRKTSEHIASYYLDSGKIIMKHFIKPIIANSPVIYEGIL